MPQLASDKYCTGCLACVDSCNHSAINIVQKNGLTHVAVNSDNCIDCGLCEKHCPIITPIKRNILNSMSIWGGWCTEENLRIKGASGGAFAGLAKSFFHMFDKVVVAGANLCNNRVRHIFIDKEKDIELLMNSKYIQSDTQGIYMQTAQKLKEGYHVLFSGTPCQVAGLYGYLGKKRSEFLYTIELICHGIPGNEALDLHLEYYKSKKIYSFRDKIDGQCNSQRTTIDIDGDAIKIKRDKDIFYRVFSGWLLDRKSCSNCVYSSIERIADITIADFWGGPFKTEEYKKGVSLIIANNQHAEEFIKHAQFMHLSKANLMQAMNSNPNLYDGFKYIQYHPLVMFPCFFRKVLPKKVWFQIVTNRMPWKLLWAVYKILTIQHSKRVKENIINKYHIR